MSSTDFELVFAALERAQVRYLVVGGVAVVLHGHPRFTADLDLVVALEPDNIRAAVTALEALGFRPRAPISLSQLADEAIRRSWIEEKSLTVVSLWSPNHPATEVDIFVEEPLPFAAAHARAVVADLGSCRATLASIPDLIALKRRVGRPKDLDDIAALEAILKDSHG